MLRSQVAVFEDGFTYTADGELTVVKRAWANVPSGLTNQQVYDLVISGDLSASGTFELLDGEAVPPGTTIWWTYTVLASYEVNGVPYGGSTDVGLIDVVVSDDQLTGDVCTIPTVYLNTPTGCAASGTVDTT